MCEARRRVRMNRADAAECKQAGPCAGPME
jgi:hypothetical protein